MSPLLIASFAAAGFLVLSRAMSRSPLIVQPMTPLGPAALAVALAEIGVTEDLGKNDGARIREYWEGTSNGPPSNWCAAFTRHCLHVAAASRDLPLTVDGSVGAKATRDQFIAAERWIPVAELRAQPALLQPGMVPVWDRSLPGRDETSWWGHIGFCAEGAAAGSFASVEGNSGATGESVALMARNLRDPRLLGVGVP